MLRGILASKSGSGTGLELWLSDSALMEGQTDLMIHLQEESATAFFGGTKTSDAYDVDGKLVELVGIFNAHSVESMSGDILAIGKVENIEYCGPPSREGPKHGIIINRPKPLNKGN